MLEFEKKIILTEREYLFLINHRYIDGKSCVQINYYYDTENFDLNQKGITCRIREKSGVFTATIKTHKTNLPDCSTENSYQLKGRQDDSVFAARGLNCRGSLTTVRTAFLPRPGLKVLLDKNHYLGTVDYELEIEYEGKSEALAVNELEDIAYTLFSGFVISNTNSFFARVGRGESKSARFFQRKAESAFKDQTKISN